jgi:septal ring factor EnvC (AmiA/AmiB activator)
VHQPLSVRIGWKFLAALGLGLLLSGALAEVHARDVTERAKQKRVVESERADLQKKLNDLKREIDRTETAKSSAADALAHSETAISEANRSLHELTEEQTQTETLLSQLAKQKADLAITVEARQRQLAQLLRAEYLAGNEDRFKLLLSGDNPNRINRDLQYMGYVSRAQARLVETLRGSLQAVESNQTQAQDAKAAMDEIAKEAQEKKTVLEAEQARHKTLLASLSDKLASQRKQAGSIQRDEQRLAVLVDKLSKLVEQQRVAEVAAQEKRRQELARAKAERARQRDLKAAKNGKNEIDRTRANPEAIGTDEDPAKSIAQNEPSQHPGTPSASGDGAFRNLRGRLSFPLRGELAAKFGSKRGEGPNWKGLFIRAAEGAEVRAVAAGKVVFADWLRGFGNLLIVDHGAQYMTIYGNNQAVLKRAGDSVKAGEVIASTGNSGGNEQSGLYFEMRHEGRAFDPLAWLAPANR